MKSDILKSKNVNVNYMFGLSSFLNCGKSLVFLVTLFLNHYSLWKVI